jgi:hypothetical protein
LNKLLSIPAHTDNYNDFTIQGRFISGFADLLIVFVVYKITQLLTEKYKWSKSTPLCSSFFYAIAVLPVQLSHFFAVDTFLSLFMVSSFYFALKSYIQYDEKIFIGRIYILNLLSSAIFMGLAIASKVNAVFILPLNLLFFFLPIIYVLYKKQKKEQWLRLVAISALLFIIYMGVMYLTVRLANPYYFESSGFLDPTPNTLFMSNLRSLKSFEGKDVWFPPAVQWMSKQPVIYSIKNLALIGLGLPNFLCVIIGFVYIVLQMKKKGLQLEIALIAVWVAGFFLYQSTQFVKALRYFIFIYPFLAVFAGVGIMYIANESKKRLKNLPVYFPYVIISILLLLWPLAFMSIYVHKNSRVEASEWIFKNLENNALILTEHWDDGHKRSKIEIITYGKYTGRFFNLFLLSFAIYIIPTPANTAKKG